jgi:hypothetical protein
MDPGERKNRDGMPACGSVVRTCGRPRPRAGCDGRDEERARDYSAKEGAGLSAEPRT